MSHIDDGREKKWQKHIICEGSREHVIWYDTNGAHCSEPHCEMNRPAIMPDDYISPHPEAEKPKDDPLAEAKEIMDRRWGHACAPYDPEMLEALSLLEDAIVGRENAALASSTNRELVKALERYRGDHNDRVANRCDCRRCLYVDSLLEAYRGSQKS